MKKKCIFTLLFNTYGNKCKIVNEINQIIDSSQVSKAFLNSKLRLHTDFVLFPPQGLTESSTQIIVFAFEDALVLFLSNDFFHNI